MENITRTVNEVKTGNAKLNYAIKAIDIDDGFVAVRNEDGSYSVSIYNLNGLTNFAKFAKTHDIVIDDNHSIDFDI